MSERMFAPEAPGELLQWFLDNDFAALDVARRSPGHLSELIERQSEAGCSPGAIINASVCALAQIDESGRVIARTPQFDECGLGDAIDLGEFEPLGKDLSFARIATARGTQLVILTTQAALSGWRLPASWQAPAEAPAHLALVPYFRSEHALGYACYSAGLNETQARAVLASIRHGSIRKGAASAGLSYQRARALVAQALAVTGNANFPGLVSQLTMLSIGLLPNLIDFDDLVRDMWGLTARQVSLMGLIAAGITRKEAAATLGLSEAVAKKEMAAVYQTLGIESAVDLSLFLTEHLLLGMLEGSNVRIREFVDLQSEPLAFFKRPDGSRIAVSDYGPRSGRPVFYIHSSMTTRPVPRRLLAALAARGFRTIAIDRPGFGSSAPAAGDQFEAAARDFEIVRQGLGIERPLALARGGAQMLLELARLNPGALGGALVINPDPRTPVSAARNGPLGAVKELFRANPAVIAFAAKVISSRLNRADVGKWLVKSVAGSPADEAAAQSDEVRDDYWRMIRGLVTGAVDGYVAEQVALASGVDRPLEGPSWRWQFFIGAQDRLHDPAEVERHWMSLIPEAGVNIVGDAGRLLAFTHAEMLIEELAALDS